MFANIFGNKPIISEKDKGTAPTLEFRLKMVKFRPISDQILREIQTKSDHFLGKFGLYE